MVDLNYDRIWCALIIESPKADSYVMVRRSIFPEKYLFQVKSLKHKIALSVSDYQATC